MPEGFLNDPSRTNYGVCDTATQTCKFGNNYRKKGCRRHEDCDGPVDAALPGVIKRMSIVDAACDHTKRPNGCVKVGPHYTTGPKKDPSKLESYEGTEKSRNFTVSTDMRSGTTPFIELTNEYTSNVFPQDGYLELPHRWFVRASDAYDAHKKCNAQSTYFNSARQRTSGYDILYTASPYQQEDF